MSPDTTVQVGTVAVLRTRIYELDANHPRVLDGRYQERSEAIVPPGEYPLFHEDGQWWWVMKGCVNGRAADVEFERIPDVPGAFSIIPPLDTPTEEPVEVASRKMPDDEWWDFVNDPDDVCAEGSSAQRLRVTVSRAGLEPTRDCAPSRLGLMGLRL